MSVLTILGHDGIERILDLVLNKRESTQFSKSVSAIRKDLAKLNI